jgi:hypothetical protein
VKLLFDENLSARLARDLADLHPGSAHVQDAGLTGAADRAVWEHAATLESVAALVLQHESLYPAGHAVFGAYERFLEILGDEEQRLHLERLSPADAADDPAYNSARAFSHDFQDGLNQLFLSDSSPLKDLTLRYGIF